ncbi:hypothetical protein [Amycolatopsis jiangsuensis]|uniref:Uncharacterized protein n=1 Tax=Amycolatopsis jiangsuensis TaxID=1181879 RepID=A0A840IPB6_9PSEU|nr:hypothetical protein [Amycolatopsis jiangsuensis]MBB4682904.1 hypothetical protein [Amycolatopsis jiangsuensis]
MTSLITGSNASGTADPAEGIPADGRTGDTLGSAAEHAAVRIPAQATVTSPLRRLSAMASVRRWEQRTTPALMHEAVLGGAGAREVAESAGLSVAEAHVCWTEWAALRLVSPRPGEMPELTVQQFLRVHGAFAGELAPHDA